MKREREVSDGCAPQTIRIAFLAFVLAIWAFRCAAQPDAEFRSLFQIRRVIPDTVQILHIGYNLRVTAAGVECVPTNPANGSMPAISVQTWIRGDAGEWIGVTKSGATVTLWGVGQAQYLEIDSGREVLFLYYGAPALLTLKMDEKQ